MLLAAFLFSGSAGCSSSDEPEELEFGTERGDLNPEDVRASDAEVAEGLGEIVRYTDEVAQTLATDPALAATAEEKILPIWESILGTVKANDEAAFETLSESFAATAVALGSGDAALARTAADTVAETAQAYLREHPGGTASPTPTPTVTAHPSTSQ